MQLASRDPSKWKIIKIVEGDDPSVTFQAGTYTNKAGTVIPVIFTCHKSGIIYKMWLQELQRRQKIGKLEEVPTIEMEVIKPTLTDRPAVETSGMKVIDIEGELIDIEAREGEKKLPKKFRDASLSKMIGDRKHDDENA